MEEIWFFFLLWFFLLIQSILQKCTWGEYYAITQNTPHRMTEGTKSTKESFFSQRFCPIGEARRQKWGGRYLGLLIVARSGCEIDWYYCYMHIKMECRVSSAAEGLTYLFWQYGAIQCRFSEVIRVNKSQII